MSKNWLQYKDLVYWNTIPKIEKIKKNNNRYKWFPDGRLNVAFNCLIKNKNKKKDDKIALHLITKNLEIKNVTYAELRAYVEKFSHFLKKKLNNKKKISVIFLGPSSLESAIVMLSCSQLGINFSVIFDDLSIAAIKQRIKLVKCDFFITNNKNLNFKEI